MSGRGRTGIAEASELGACRGRVLGYNAPVMRTLRRNAQDQRRFLGSTTTALIAIGALKLVFPSGLLADEPSYEEIVREGEPVAYWRFSEKTKAVRPVNGPRPARYPAFTKSNRAAFFSGSGEVITVADPGKKSDFDFDLGDTISIEAWVSPDAITDGMQRYIVGKGRTNRAGFARENQNWSLRLRGAGGTARLSFLFRDRDNRPPGHPAHQSDWHRWTSTNGIEIASGWHHVLLSYTFGRSASVRAYIDGVETKGMWDLGGASDEAPVVDDDEVWIGSSLGRSPTTTFVGGIDEVAIYRRALSIDEIRRRVKIDSKIPVPRKIVSDPHVPPTDLPSGAVRAGVFEGIHDRKSWQRDAPPEKTEEFDQRAFAFVDVPHKYTTSGVRVDRSNPYLLSASGICRLPPGKYRFLLRSFSSARLWIDGKKIAETRFQTRNADGHEAVPDVPAVAHPTLRPLPPGHAEKLVHIDLAKNDRKNHARWIRLDAVIGGKGLRQETGELVAAYSRDEGPFVVLSPTSEFALDDESWDIYRDETRLVSANRNRESRNRQNAHESEYWTKRHEFAREYVKSGDPIPGVDMNGRSASEVIDALIDVRLRGEGVEPAEEIDDAAFLRRTSLDLRGTIPTPEEVLAFELDKSKDRRAHWIDRLLDDPSWADHWVGYWQDVLAENPGILKPKLNNSGPFRWCIHESFLDNKPIDRFVTELVMMEGSKYGGGPKGFELATQNDVPMAAKAHILGTAFLGVEMKCARCHDAPFHPWRQHDLFSVAAMLKRKDQSVPKSSSVPRSKEELEEMMVEVTLAPGSKVKPSWPFANIAPERPDASLLRNSKDPREQLAAIITGPQNPRFAKVIANRLWKRYLGYGFVEPVDDWNLESASHPELLEFLARELTTNGYDLKHLARVIVSSKTYARAPQPDVSGGDPSRVPDPEERLFRGPIRRRLTAEQVVDSLFAAVGKPLDSEELNLDVDGRRPITAFLNLGTPRRAWEFTSLSNERDRPALSMPVAQSITDVLKAFGWRETRQDPITVREETPTVIQPLLIANGTVAHRVSTLSDGATITELAMRDIPLDQFIDGVFSRLLTRAPSKTERELFTELLEPGYSVRFRELPSGARKKKARRHAVSWSNHLHADATRIKMEMEAAARAGDPPTDRLVEDWRARAEDMVWALINSPEFLFVP